MGMIFFTKVGPPTFEVLCTLSDRFDDGCGSTVRGWVNYYPHTNARDAFRRLQRFINTRFRLYLNYHSRGRGFGWKQYPNAALYTLGIIYIGSGVISTSESLRMLWDEDCRTAGLGRTERPVGWEGNGEPATRTLMWHCRRGNPQKQIGVL